MKICCIYTITNTVNDKVYVGYSTDVEERWKSHIKGLKGNYHDNQYLQKTYQKYGIDNLKFEILEEWPPEMLVCMEHWWCMVLNSHNRNYGYNIQPTHPYGKRGHSEETLRTMNAGKIGKKQKEEHKRKAAQARTGLKRSQETKDKIAVKSRLYRHTEETKKKLSEIRKEWSKNNPLPFKGRKHTEESKRKMSIAGKGQHGHNKRIVEQYSISGEYIKEWESSYHVEKELGINANGIRMVCTNHQNRKIAGGYTWKYKQKQ